MEIEERAKLMGWVPQEDFKGDPERWTPAEEYVERADNIMPIMKAQNRDYEEKLHATREELKATRTELKSLKKTLDNVVRVNTKVSEREYERALETIRKEQAAAIENNDGARFKELEADKDKLISNKPEKIEVDTQQTGADPDFDSWVASNQWYNTDIELREYADYAAGLVRKSSPNIVGTAFFEEVKKKVMGVYPAKFENPNRKQASDVDGGDVQGSGGKKKGKTYNNLPMEAKQACDNFVSDGLGTKEEYIKAYFEGEE